MLAAIKKRVAAARARLCWLLGHEPFMNEGTNVFGGFAHRAYCRHCPARSTWVTGTPEDARRELRRMR